jgi:hypothetical protein
MARSKSIRRPRYRSVDDADMARLGKSPSLVDLELWATGVTDAGIASLRKQRPQIRVHRE